MPNPKLTKRVESELQRIVAEYGYSESVLREFAKFLLQPDTPPKSKSTESKSTARKPKGSKVKGLSLPELKQSIYKHFQVKDTVSLKQSGAFQMATSSMETLDLSKKAAWESLYRKVIGILPGEENEQGYGCVNGIDIFKYNLPWKAFGLDPKTATTQEIKSAYRELSKIYHPDTPNTGDTRIFDRLTIFYKSLTERF